MRPRELSNALRCLIPARRPIYLWGSPGEGKSAVVRQAAGTLKLKLAAEFVGFLQLYRERPDLDVILTQPETTVYWIPGPKLDEWAAIAEAVEAASEGKPSSVYLLRHRLDADAGRAIRDAVVTKVQTATSRIADGIAAGELGSRALETRKQQALDLREKVLLYEDLLNVGLAELHRAIDSADQSAATASLLLAAQTHLSATLA